MSEHKPKGRITMATVEAMAHRIEGMDETDVVRELDELATRQPKAMGFVVALHRLGLSPSEMDHVLDLVLLVAMCFEEAASGPLPQINEEMLEAAAKMANAMGRLIAGDVSTGEIGMVVESHPERDLLVYILARLDALGMTTPGPDHERAAFAVVVMIETFRQAAPMCRP